MRTVVRNSFARHTVLAERVPLRLIPQPTCTGCGQRRQSVRKGIGGTPWLYRFRVDDDQGSRSSGPIAGGKLFCSRGCCESYTGQPFDETR